MAAPPVPAFLAGLLNKNLDTGVSQGIVGFARPAHISIEKNRFSLVDDKGEAEMLREFEIEMIVVGANNGISKLYYVAGYDPSATERNPPECSSDNGVAPSVNALSPQNPTCQGCRWNVWGSDQSALTGKNIKACSDRKKLAVLYNGEIYQFVIPPASLKNWKVYAEFIAKHPNVSINIVKTQVKFDDKVQGVLNFTATGFIGERDAAEVHKIMAKGADALDFYTGNDDKPRTAAIEGPKPGLTGARDLRPIEERIVHVDPKPAVAPVAAKGNGAVGNEAGFVQGEQPARKTTKGGNKAAPFGMVDTQAVDDPSLENAIGKAMGFLKE